MGQSGIAMAFARQGAIGADATATAAMADMVHGEGLPDGFLEKPKVKAAMMAYKAPSSAYELPGAKQVGGLLLDSLSAQYTRHSKENMDMYKEDYGLACVSDGATVIRTPLVNVLAVVMSSIMLLSVVDCSGYMAEGGKKDGSFIAKEMGDAMAILGHKYSLLAILDGASNRRLVSFSWTRTATTRRSTTRRRAKGGGRARGGVLWPLAQLKTDPPI